MVQGVMHADVESKDDRKVPWYLALRDRSTLIDTSKKTVKRFVQERFIET